MHVKEGIVQIGAQPQGGGLHGFTYPVALDSNCIHGRAQLLNAGEDDKDTQDDVPEDIGTELTEQQIPKANARGNYSTSLSNYRKSRAISSPDSYTYSCSFQGK